MSDGDTDPGKTAAVRGLGLTVLDRQVFVERHPEIDTKVFADRHREQTGGPVPIALAQLVRLGHACELLASWADDPTGHEIEGDLRRRGVGLDRVNCRTATTSGFAHVWVETSTGRRTLVSVRPDAEPDPAAAAEFGRGAAVLHLDGWGGEAAIAAAEAARASDGLVTLDAGSPKPTTPRLLELAEVVNAPRKFIRAFCGTDDPAAAAAELLARGPRLVTVTDGPRGAGVYAAGEAVWLPAFEVAAVDTCGAGDAFCGGLIHAVAGGFAPVAALRLAMATAALKVTRLGNREALPDLAAVEHFLARHEGPQLDLCSFRGGPPRR